LDLNKNAAGATCSVTKIQDNYLSSGNRRDSRKPLDIKATHTDAQKAIARLFVSHNDEIITHAFYACSKYKQSDKIAPARRPQKTLGLPAGGFCVCYDQSAMENG
jgi:hypothetical protein